MKPIVATLDLEGVFTPEVWINVAEKTGVEDLRLTTRDISDYNELMQRRLKILDREGITLKQIQEVIAGLKPLEGAVEFLDWLKGRLPVIILSDTFYEFAAPLMAQLGNHTLFCNSLEVDAQDHIVGYRLRLPDQKRQSVKALKELNFNVIAAGDSYNDTTMLVAADAGILFRPPQNVIDEFPQFPVTTTYEELKEQFEKAVEKLNK